MSAVYAIASSAVVVLFVYALYRWGERERHLEPPGYSAEKETSPPSGMPPWTS